MRIKDAHNIRRQNGGAWNANGASDGWVHVQLPCVESTHYCWPQSLIIPSMIGPSHVKSFEPKFKCEVIPASAIYYNWRVKHVVDLACACRIPDTAAKLNIGTLALAVKANMTAPTRVYATDSSDIRSMRYVTHMICLQEQNCYNDKDVNFLFALCHLMVWLFIYLERLSKNSIIFPRWATS